MAAKPPPPADLLREIGNLLGGSGLRGEVDKSAKMLAQSALRRLDMVSREEFDAQAEVLARTRERVEELEAQLEALLAAGDAED